MSILFFIKLNFKILRTDIKCVIFNRNVHKYSSTLFNCLTPTTEKGCPQNSRQPHKTHVHYAER